MKQAHIFISGFVQGVGFRVFVRNNARKRVVTGWVRNLSDGRVEGVFVGEKAMIDELIHLCNKGPFLAEVQEVDIQWEEAKEMFDDFILLKDT